MNDLFTLHVLGWSCLDSRSVNEAHTQDARNIRPGLLDGSLGATALGTTFPKNLDIQWRDT